jgi:hypothetical protein
MALTLHTLPFRFIRVRDDKSPEDATGPDMIVDLYQKQTRKLQAPSTSSAVTARNRGGAGPSRQGQGGGIKGAGQKRKAQVEGEEGEGYEEGDEMSEDAALSGSEEEEEELLEARGGGSGQRGRGGKERTADEEDAWL